MIIDSIRDYIGGLDCLQEFENAINVNYLDDITSSFSIEEIPCNPVVKKYTDGSTKKQYQFAFCGREPYSQEILQNIENSSFYEKFAREIETKNTKGDLPILDTKLEATNIEVISNAYTLSVTEDTSMYQIQIKLNYLEVI